MNFDRLSAFMGKPIYFNGHRVISPTVSEILNLNVEHPEIEYRIKLILSTFDKERILLNLFQIPLEMYEQIENEDDYDVLTDNQIIANHIAEAISFFVKKEVQFDYMSKNFHIQDSLLISRHNYRDFILLINILNGLEKIEDKKQQITFKNDKAKSLFEMLNKVRKKVSEKKSDDSGLELKDILSILCNADGNGINIFNVSQLTIYQVYEHFERESIKYTRNTILPVWANGHLKDGDKLPEYIIKTNF